MKTNIFLLFFAFISQVLFANQFNKKEIYFYIGESLFMPHPIFGQHRIEKQLRDLLFSPLIKKTSAGWQPVLIEEIPQALLVHSTDKAERPIRYEVSVRTSAKWDDGTPVTAKDYQLFWLLSRKLGVMRADLERLSFIELDAKDPCLLILYFNEHSPQNIRALENLYALPSLHEFKFVFLDQTEYKNKTIFYQKGPKKGIFNGPYAIDEEASKERSIVLRKSPYWEEPILFEKISFQTTTVRSDFEELLKNPIGYSVFMDVHPSLRPVFYDLIKKDNLPVVKHGYRTDILECIIFNTQNEILKNQMLRDHLAQALSFVEINKLIKHYHHAYMQLSQGDSFFNYLPNKSHIPTGVSEALKGTKIEISVDTGNEFREKLAQLLKQQWEAVGFHVLIKKIRPELLFEKKIPEGDFQVALASERFSSMSQLSSMLGSEFVPQKWSREERNYSRIKSRQLDQSLFLYKKEVDLEKKRQLLLRVKEIFASKKPFVVAGYRSGEVFSSAGMAFEVPKPEVLDFLQPFFWKIL